MAVTTYKDIVNNNYNLAPSQLITLSVPNKNKSFIRDLLDRKLEFSDNGKEVGSVNYISKSPKYFIRAKALQKESFLPFITEKTAVPIRPQVFTDFDLKESDILISKDSNIGEVVILDQDLPNHTISGALYKLPIQENKYYLFAFLKHKYFLNQLDLMVPKGSTIRHAKTFFLDCKIPFPNQENKDDVISYVELLTQAIINKEKEIRKKHREILDEIEKELLENQKDVGFKYKEPTFQEIKEIKRLDTGVYIRTFKKIDFLIKNYQRGYFFIPKEKIKSGSTPIKRIIGKNQNFNYRWVTPTHISDYGTLTKEERINCVGNNLIKDSLLIINRTSKGGLGEYVGMTMFYAIDMYGKAHHNQGIYRIENYSKLELIFMGLFLNSTLMRKYCANLSIGSKMKELKSNQFTDIPFPNFSDNKQKEIVSLYHNPVNYSKTLNLKTFLSEDQKWNKKAGIIELDKSLKKMKEHLNNVLDRIVNDEIVEIKFV